MRSWPFPPRHRVSTIGEIAIEKLLGIRSEGPLPQRRPQRGRGQPPVPGHLIRVGGADLGKHGIAYANPDRAEPAPVEEREPQAHWRRCSQLLTELTGSCLLIGLADCRSAPGPEFVVPGETGQVLGTPMDGKAALLVATHDHGNPVEPALPNGFTPIDYPQHTVLSVDAFYEFVHDAQDRSTH